MSEQTKLALIGAAALVLAAFLVGGLYTVVVAPPGRAYVVNRFTGVTWFCAGETCGKAAVNH